MCSLTLLHYAAANTSNKKQNQSGVFPQLKQCIISPFKWDHEHTRKHYLYQTNIYWMGIGEFSWNPENVNCFCLYVSMKNVQTWRKRCCCRTYLPAYFLHTHDFPLLMARLGVCKIMMEVLEFYSIMHRTSVAPTTLTSTGQKKPRMGPRKKPRMGPGSGHQDVKTSHHGATSLKRCRSHQVFHNPTIHLFEVQLLLYLFMLCHKGHRSNIVLSHMRAKSV